MYRRLLMADTSTSSSSPASSDITSVSQKSFISSETPSGVMLTSRATSSTSGGRPSSALSLVVALETRRAGCVPNVAS